MRTGSEYLGRAWMCSAPAATAGQMATLQLVYEAGRYGIDDCGSFLVAWRGISDMAPPQFDRADAPGYTTALTDSAARLHISFTRFKRPYHNAIKIDVIDGFLREGERITLTLGDRRAGSPGIRMQTLCEREFELLPMVDACGTGRFERVPDTLYTRILPAESYTLQVWAPGMVRPGEDFSIALRSLDAFGNVAPASPGRVSLRAWSPGGGAWTLPETAVLEAGNDGMLSVPGCRVEQEGVYYFIAQGGAGARQAYSSPCICKGGGPRLFWGDMHGQTRETLGCGRLDDYLRFARDCARIDVASWQGNDLEITDRDWSHVRAQSERFNEEGKFLVFLGYEWSGTTNGGGDHNVYFLDDSENFYPSSNWIVPGEAKVEHNTFPISELFEKMRGRGDFMVVPHIGGRRANLDFYDEEFLHNIEIHSLHGIFEWFALDAMKRRLRVGFLATSDDHTCHPGLGYPCMNETAFKGSLTVRSGLSGIYAEALTKRAVWDALKRRRCYASTLDRLYLETHLEGHGMGEEYRGAAGPKSLDVLAAGTDALDALFIYDWDSCIARIPLAPKRRDAVRIRLSGVTQKDRNKTAHWNGRVRVSGGKILSAARSGHLLGLGEAALDPLSGVLSFQAITNGESKGYVLALDMDEQSQIHIETNFGSLECSVATLREQGLVAMDMGGENLRVELDFANEEAPAQEARLQRAQLAYSHRLDAAPGAHAYWVKLLQEDGNAAWSSPIYIDC